MYGNSAVNINNLCYGYIARYITYIFVSDDAISDIVYIERDVVANSDKFIDDVATCVCACGIIMNINIIFIYNVLNY